MLILILVAVLISAILYTPHTRDMIINCLKNIMLVFVVPFSGSVLLMLMQNGLLAY